MTQKRGEEEDEEHSVEELHDTMFAPDEDPDLNIYFNPPQTLLEYLKNLEEDNLFKINLVQEDEQALEKEKKKIHENITTREAEINEVLKNIETLEQFKAELLKKQYFLEGNMKGNTTKHSSKEAQKLMQSLMQMGNNATESSVMDATTTSKVMDASVAGTFIEPQSSLMQFYHDQVMKGRSVKFEEIQRISDLIYSLLSNAGI